VLGLELNTHLPLLVRRYVGATLVFERALHGFNQARPGAADFAI